MRVSRACIINRRLASLPTPPLFIVPLGLGEWLRANNGTEDDPSTVIELDWWEDHVLPSKWPAPERSGDCDDDEAEETEREEAEPQRQPGLRIIATPCQHWSNRGLFDKCKSLWFVNLTIPLQWPFLVAEPPRVQVQLRSAGPNAEGLLRR